MERRNYFSQPASKLVSPKSKVQGLKFRERVRPGRIQEIVAANASWRTLPSQQTSAPTAVALLFRSMRARSRRRS